MGAILSGAWHIICAFNKGILFIGILEDPAVPVWAGESAMTWRGNQPFHHVFPLRFFSIFHFFPLSKHNCFIAQGSREELWGWLGFKGILRGPWVCWLWGWQHWQHLCVLTDTTAKASRVWHILKHLQNALNVFWRTTQHNIMTASYGNDHVFLRYMRREFVCNWALFLSPQLSKSEEPAKYFNWFRSATDN